MTMAVSDVVFYSSEKQLSLWTNSNTKHYCVLYVVFKSAHKKKKNKINNSKEVWGKALAKYWPFFFFGVCNYVAFKCNKSFTRAQLFTNTSYFFLYIYTYINITNTRIDKYIYIYNYIYELLLLLYLNRC